MLVALDRLRHAGSVPVFPLPDVVFFPHATLPLHVFEPRYRRMTEDVLKADRLIAVALLQPGWQREYQGSPAVHAVASVGYVEDEVRLPGGRFNIRLRGLARVELEAFVQERPYRAAKVRLLADRHETDGPGIEEERRHLLASCASLLQEISGRPEQALSFEGSVPFAVIVNSLCQSLAIEAEAKQALLLSDDVLERSRALREILDRRWREMALRGAGKGSSRQGSVH